MKRIALALIACAGCGLLAGRTQPEPPAVACSPAGPAEKPVVRSVQPVETPLVAKLLPGGDVKEAPSKAAPPKGTEHLVGDKAWFLDRNVNLYIDGTRTAGGLFEYEAARNIFVPVDFGHTRYTENGHAPTAEHLIREHGHARSSAEKWTQREREIAHANDHAVLGPVRQVAPPRYTSSCPNGQCGNPSYGRGLFGRRR